MTKRPVYKVGDRIRLSTLGKERNPRLKANTGIVVAVPKGGGAVEFLFEGNSRPTKLHHSYLQGDDDSRQ